MNIFTGSPFLISLMSTVALLPFFLFTLPAGVLADKVDRRKLICFVNVGLATLTASELWVAAQRAMPDWARGRMNATVIMISQGAMALGGLIWGSAAAIAGARFAMLGAAVLFLASLLLFSRLSINLARNLEETVSGFLSGNAEPEQIPPIALTNELLQPE